MGGVKYNPVLSMIKFPLAYLVVVLHLGLHYQHDFYPNAGILHLTEEFINMFEVLFSKYIVHLAVPTFFVISGYLFSRMSMNLLEAFIGLKSRVVPYRFFSLISCGIFFI